MSDMLKRSLAPVTDEAWAEIENTAKQTLKPLLSARKLVDFKGPKGWDYAAVNLGRLDMPKKPGQKGVGYGIRKVLPLLEARVMFTLRIWELDNVARGAADPDLGPLEEAAKEIALFEERAIYAGFKEGHIDGIIPTASQKAVVLPADVNGYAKAVAQGIDAMQADGIGGPYALVLGAAPYQAVLQAVGPGYPIRRGLERLLEGDGVIMRSRALDGGVLLSTRGGDFEMTVGTDLSIGYSSHDSEMVNLFLTESFTFRVIQPAAAVELRLGK
ncbi:MAG TPA: family 1 encapsulin nanocompartment shell protein [Candidatus Hydrogenedentes bacterium]|nr:family 1 encapsulin nanocompartment shell protein [Candidatus Hydrogenedentota bacterium]HQH51994.1 family 1 encapsulin nanocompartment shell protein [Candidatus Hydrogenedentota bacterium]HQM50142.1 family 1 encapsulin nanocompartment shell protein [Candidatus Hydrogenedentota bacterium]